VAVGLAPVIGFAAAALGTTVAAWAMVALLWRGTRDMGEVARLDARARTRSWRIVLAALGMGVAVWVANVALAPLSAAGLRPLALLVLVLTGAAAFFALAQAFGGMRMAELRGALRRG
jgi:putative peptidoglycan lipid II flippase